MTICLMEGVAEALVPGSVSLQTRVSVFVGLAVSFTSRLAVLSLTDGVNTGGLRISAVVEGSLTTALTALASLVG